MCGRVECLAGSKGDMVEKKKKRKKKKKDSANW